MPDESFQPPDLHTVMQTMDALCRRVVERRQRIEFCNDGWADHCVIISKTELNALERAVDLLVARTHAGHEMQERVRALCGDCMEELQPPVARAGA